MKDGSGMVGALRFGEWCRGQSRLLTMRPTDAAETIQHRFVVSRATAFRWLSAWREVAAVPNNQGNG